MKTYKYVVQLNGVKFTTKVEAQSKEDLKAKAALMYGKKSAILSIRELN